MASVSEISWINKNYVILKFEDYDFGGNYCSF